MNTGQTQAMLAKVLKQVQQADNDDVVETIIVVTLSADHADSLLARFCAMLGAEGVVFLARQSQPVVRVGRSIVKFVTKLQEGDANRFRGHRNISWFHDHSVCGG